MAFDYESQRRYDLVAMVAQESGHRNSPFSATPIDEETGEPFPCWFTVNARKLTGDVLREAVRVGLVVPAGDDARDFLALTDPTRQFPASTPGGGSDVG